MNYFKTKLHGVLLLTTFFLGWAIKDVFIKINLFQADPLVVTFVVSISALLSAVFMRFIRRRTSLRRPSLQVIPNNRLLPFGLALFTATAITSSVYAINLIGPVTYTITDGIIYSLSVLFLSTLLLKENMQKSTIIGLFIAIAGGICFYWGDINIKLMAKFGGGILAAISSLSYAFSLVFIKKLLRQNVSTNDILIIRFSLLGVISVIGLLLTRPSINPISLIYLILIGCIGYTGLLTILFEGLRNVPANLFSVFVASSPLFSSAMTWLLIPNTTYSVWQIISLIIIFIGFLFPVVQLDKNC